VTIIFTCVRSTIATTRSASSAVSTMGLSRRTCFPASAARRMTSNASDGSTRTHTASMSSASTTSSSREQRVALNFAASARK